MQTPAALPGKKLWAWGPDDAWVRDNLTENFPSYIEIQAGALPNQEARSWLGPQESRSFTEYWMPAREFDGVSRANLAGVLYLGRGLDGGGQTQLIVQLNVNSAFSGATVQVLEGANAIVSDVANLIPSATYTRTVGRISASSKYSVKVLDAMGNVLLAHTEDQYDAMPSSSVTLGPQPLRDLSSNKTAEDILARADNEEQMMKLAAAEADYQLGLKLFPGSNPLRKASGRLALSAARYDDAAARLSLAVSATPDDAEAKYYLGLGFLGQGKYDAASQQWNSVLTSAAFGRAAASQLGMLRALTGDLAGSIQLFEAALAGRTDAVRAAAMQIAVLRHNSQASTAVDRMARWLTIAPTDLMLRFERTLQGVTDDSLWSDLGAEPERVLTLVDDYLSLGFYDDALNLLARAYPEVPANTREPGSVAPRKNALIAYYRGYCRERMGSSGSGDFRTGSTLPLQYPSRSSSFAVLRRSIQAAPGDGTAHYLMGLLWMSRRHTDEAIAEWQLARSVRNDFPALQRNLGRAVLDIQSDAATALPILKEGLTIDPANSEVQDAYQRATAALGTRANCSFTLARAGANTSAAGTLGTVGYTPSAPGCEWRAVSYSTWITIASQSSGTGAGTASYSVAPNATQNARSGVMSIAGQLFTVVQDAGGSLAVPPPSGLVQVCTVADVGVAAGTNFTFSVSGMPVTIPAGSPPGGTCGTPIPAASGPAVITEILPGDVVLTGVSTLPSAGLLVSSSLAAGTATVTVVGGSQTIVTFIDAAANATAAVESSGVFQLKYFTMQYGTGLITATNAGTRGEGVDPTGALCANFYAFDPNEEMMACCACKITPNGLASLDVKTDIYNNLLTNNPPTSIIVKVLASDGNGVPCNAASPTAATLAPGLKLWGTTLHSIQPPGSPLPPPLVQAAETSFATAELSPGELTKLTQYCRFIGILGSQVAGMCKACRAGALAGAGQ